MIGPLETQEQAARLPAVREIYDAAHASNRRGVLGERNLAMLLDAVADAGVELGAYDARILRWLAGWEPQTCAVVGGLISRAAGGQAPALDQAQRDAFLRMLADALEYRLSGVGATCKDYDVSPAELCADHAADLTQIEAYRQLAVALGFEMTP